MGYNIKKSYYCSKSNTRGYNLKKVITVAIMLKTWEKNMKKVPEKGIRNENNEKSKHGTKIRTLENVIMEQLSW